MNGRAPSWKCYWLIAKKIRLSGSEIFHLGARGKPREPQEVARQEFSVSSENSEFVIVALKKQEKREKEKKDKTIANSEFSEFSELMETLVAAA